MPTVAAQNRRQTLLYEDTCDIWKPDTISLAADGKPTDTTYTRIAQGQVCYFFTKTEVAQPQVIGRMGSDIIFTLDILKIPASVDIDDTYVVKLTTSGHPREGTFWRVEGEKQARMNRARRQADSALVYLKLLPRAPTGVS